MIWYPSQPPPRGYSEYPYFGCSAKNQVLHPAFIFYVFLKYAQEIHLLQLGIGRLSGDKAHSGDLFEHD